jgi:hypothetical protein
MFIKHNIYDRISQENDRISQESVQVSQILGKNIQV